MTVAERIFSWLGWDYDPRTGEPLPSDTPYRHNPELNAKLQAYTIEINKEFLRANKFAPYMKDAS
jgi:hypothetical protein